MDNVAEALYGRDHWLDGHSIFVQYLIVCNDDNRLKLFTLPADSGETLPVFGSEVAARAFLRFNRCDAKWHVRESTAGELISLLMGHIADVNQVTLDPLSAATKSQKARPETVDKRDFISSLMREPMLLSHN